MSDMRRIHDLREKLACLAEMELDQSVESIDAEELGAVVDMIKDLAEAEHCLAMAHEIEDERRCSPENVERNIRNGDFDEEEGQRMAKAYEDYRSAKKYYTRTHSTDAKQVMHDRADMHMRNMTDNIREIWADADPEMRASMKKSMKALMDEME